MGDEAAGRIVNYRTAAPRRLGRYDGYAEGACSYEVVERDLKLPFTTTVANGRDGCGSTRSNGS
jgi:hypothetical protein